MWHQLSNFINPSRAFIKLNHIHLRSYVLAIFALSVLAAVPGPARALPLSHPQEVLALKIKAVLRTKVVEDFFNVGL